jgi:hypothetical protein
MLPGEAGTCLGDLDDLSGFLSEGAQKVGGTSEVEERLILFVANRTTPFPHRFGQLKSCVSDDSYPLNGRDDLSRRTCLLFTNNKIKSRIPVSKPLHMCTYRYSGSLATGNNLLCSGFVA